MTTLFHVTGSFAVPLPVGQGDKQIETGITHISIDASATDNQLIPDHSWMGLALPVGTNVKMTPTPSEEKAEFQVSGFQRQVNEGKWACFTFTLYNPDIGDIDMCTEYMKVDSPLDQLYSSLLLI